MCSFYRLQASSATIQHLCTRETRTVTPTRCSEERGATKMRRRRCDVKHNHFEGSWHEHSESALLCKYQESGATSQRMSTLFHVHIQMTLKSQYPRITLQHVAHLRFEEKWKPECEWQLWPVSSWIESFGFSVPLTMMNEEINTEANIECPRMVSFRWQEKCLLCNVFFYAGWLFFRDMGQVVNFSNISSRWKNPNG